MVKFFLLFFLSFFLAVNAFSPVLKVQTPLVDQGTLLIYHAPDQKVDASSFRMAGKPLKVEKASEAALSAEERRLYPQYPPSTRVSLYHFDLPEQSQGLQLLPAITAKVGKATVRSTPLTYEIADEQTTHFKLEAFLEPNRALYPGEQASLGYKITYDRAIELTMEKLPLLEAKGFEKIGGKEIEETEQENFNIQKIRQEIRAQDPGDYAFPSSAIQGHAFHEEGGSKVYEQETLRAAAPALKILVKSFPLADKPPGFTGALGTFEITASLVHGPQARVGENIELAIKISGASGLDTVHFPDLSCLPGFSGFFSLNNFPTSEQREPHTRTLTFFIRPLSPTVTQIPPIPFSYFNPQIEQYGTVQTAPLALNVRRDVREIPPENRVSSVSQPYPAEEKQEENTYNAALQASLKKEKESPPSVKLRQEISANFDALGKYGWATLYSLRSLQLDPQQASIQEELKRLQEKTGQPFFIPFLAPPWLFPALSILFALLLLMGSLLFLWKRTFSLLLALCALSVLGGLLYLHYFVPIYAVAVHSTLLRSTPAETPSVTAPAILEGTIVEVLQVLEKGEWLYIETTDHQKGYLPYTFMRIL